jgi:hypothetical protein
MTTRCKLLACLPGVVAALSLAATAANATCVFNPAADDADQMRDRHLDSGKSAAVIRHQLRQ